MTDAIDARTPTRHRPEIGRYLTRDETIQLAARVSSYLNATPRDELVRKLGKDTASRRTATADLMKLLRDAKVERGEDPIRIPHEVYDLQKRGSLNRVFDAVASGVHVRLRPRRAGDDIRVFDLYWIRGEEQAVERPRKTVARRVTPLLIVALLLAVGWTVWPSRESDGAGFEIVADDRLVRTIDGATMVYVPGGLPPGPFRHVQAVSQLT